MSNYIERYWRDAKPKDAIKEPPMVARFDGSIVTGRLRGFKAVGHLKWCNDESMWWAQCQVYDAPDPGEGWRLIDTANEKPQDGDEVFANSDWHGRSIVQFGEAIYRRRITPAATYVPFNWEDREQLRGRWITQVESTGTEQMVNKLDLITGDLFANNKLALELLTGWRFLDTGEPVGKKVTQ